MGKTLVVVCNRHTHFPALSGPQGVEKSASGVFGGPMTREGMALLWQYILTF